MIDKAEDERSVTHVRGVELGVLPDGTATPVAVVDEVLLNGHIVTRATLHNASFLRDHDVRIGDALTVRLDGSEVVVAEILPLLRTGAEEALRVPNACPVCACDLRHLGDDIVCPNATCESQLAMRVRRLVGSDGFDIPELDGGTVDELIAERLIQTPADVFRIRPSTLLRRGWSPGRVASLGDSIERSKRIPLERLLIATTGIDHEAAASIAEHARSLARVKRLAAGSLARLPHVGTRTAEAVANFMREPRNRKMLAQIARAGVTTLRAPTHAAP